MNFWYYYPTSPTPLSKLLIHPYVERAEERRQSHHLYSLFSVRTFLVFKNDSHDDLNNVNTLHFCLLHIIS